MPENSEEEFGPWNPGLSSTIPSHLMPRVTLYDPRHSFVTWDQARELSDIVGLPPRDLAVTRPERLALHSVLIRVTSQLYVPDGPSYADLGISLRSMALELHERFVMPKIAEIRSAYAAVRIEAREEVEKALSAEVYQKPPEPEPPSLMGRLLGKTPVAPPTPDPSENALRVATRWSQDSNETVASASRRALARVLGAILNTHGRLLVDRETLTEVAVGLVLNRLGSAAVGQAVEPLFDRGVEALGYRRLPPQSAPMVLNAKGASASGKSTIRAKQRAIAERLGLDWQDFAIISPDYWRKALIDYDSLGDDHKYVAMMCGNELEVIDRKLDILMAVKGAAGTVPHMLIDRFRFDSFQGDRTRAEDSTLLTRFGAKVFLFFLVTPPAATVERAWFRGLETGRFKAVDDLLFHNIEAYSGMPDLFFGWAERQDKYVHYEFLDNSVPKGSPPRTIAHGENGVLIIRDLALFCDITRFREVNVEARTPEEIPSTAVTDHDAMALLRRAMATLKRVEVVRPGENIIYARSMDGTVELDVDLVPEGVDPGTFGDFTAMTKLGNVKASSDYVIGASSG